MFDGAVRQLQSHLEVKDGLVNRKSWLGVVPQLYWGRKNLILEYYDWSLDKLSNSEMTSVLQRHVFLYMRVERVHLCWQREGYICINCYTFA